MPIGPATAQDIEPRQYTNLPFGINFLVVSSGRSEGGVLFDSTIPLTNAKIDTNSLLVGYARGLRLGPFSAKLDGGIGRACLDGSAELNGQPESASRCGVTDALARLTVNLIGAPPLAPGDFASYRQDLIIGASLGVRLPTGRYDGDRVLNIGANRAALKAELGVSKTLPQWIVELAVAGNWFQTNTESFGSRRVEQDPLYAIQGHAVRRLDGGRWVAVGATWYEGGETSDGASSATNFQSNIRFGVTWSRPITANQSFKLALSRGVRTRTGTDFDTLAALWQYRWGAGPGY